MDVIFYLVLLSMHSGLLAGSQQPIFSEKYAYFFNVDEGVKIGSLVGYVNATLPDPTKAITYEIFNIANNSIIINNATGALYLNTVLDADIPNLHDIKFSVSAYHDPRYKATGIVYLYIGDINDNFPVFQGQPYLANVTEGSPINTYVTKVQATDIDKNGLSELIYFIEGWNEDSLFTIKPFLGTIWTNKPLDYETLKKQVLNISVTDGRPSDSKRHTVYTQVEVLILDADDQGAKFDEYTYYASIEEGFHNMTDLIQVHASDQDKGINAPVTYSVLPASNPQGNFIIDHTSGKIKANGLIDREATGNLFYLTIQVTSTTHSPSSANAIISVNDTNDNGPVFSQSSYIGKVLENSLIGTKVIHVQANDADYGVNKALTYSLRGDSQMFSIDENGYVLVNGSLDRELKDIYNFEVHAVETYTKERNQNSTKVTIYIQDVNDNSPIFLKSYFEVSVQEELMARVFVTRVNASDADFGANSLIEYSLVPDAQNKHLSFEINHSNGTLFTARKLDRETTSVYFLLIKAVDRAPPGQTRESLCTVKVNVMDINDNPPYFSATNYVTSVTEAANLNTIVFALKAFDADVGENAKLTFFMFPTNQSQFFKIDSASGVIKTAKELDREIQSKFVLKVGVRDGGNKSSSVDVIINVLDINDNAPVFSQADGYKFNVTEEKSDAFVGYVKASDIDEGNSGKVNYDITDSNNFKIDKSSGRITTKVALDREKSSFHTITVVATDLSKTGPRKSFAKVEISVEDINERPLKHAEFAPFTSVEISVGDINDSPPVFAGSKQYSTIIRKDWQAGSFVYQFRAVDKDVAENGKVNYFITDENKELFTLNNETGILRLKAQNHSQQLNSITVHVAAFDNGTPQLNDTASIQILFANVLKNAPIIHPFVIKASLKENHPVGWLVYDINATYEGKSEEQKFRYSILHGAESKFAIHFETGKITTLAVLDREKQSKYNLVIMVKLRLQSEANFATVEVSVEDENDNRPVFSKSLYVASIYENQPIGTSITRVSATDLDVGSNAKIIYAIQGSNPFIIDENSGVVSTNSLLDREILDKYSLTVTAINMDSNVKLKSSCYVFVTVLDLDDNPPLFGKSLYEASIAENTNINSAVIKVQATDIDQGNNAEVLYDVEGSECFFIERKTGVVHTSCVLDRETTSSYQLKLIAKGSQNFSLSSTARLIVNVSDIDDNHPHFTSPVYRFDPAEDLSVGSIIGTLGVSDKDSSTGKVLYQMYSGNNAGYFHLNNETGVIQLVKELDRETIAMFTLTIRVYREASTPVQVARKRRSPSVGTKSQFDEAKVLISIKDVNDNPPVFTKTKFVAAVHKDAKFNSFIAQVHATDLDTGSNSSFFYQIISGNDESLFKIKKRAGRIVVFKSLVSENGRSIELFVSVNDNQGLHPTHVALKNAVVKIHIFGDDKAGIITVGTTAEYIHRNIEDLNRLLSNATDSNVEVYQIKPTTHKNSFLVHFYGIDKINEQMVMREQLVRSILRPSTVFIESSLAKWNISWYYEHVPTALKATSEKKYDKEIYIGVIAAMAILLLVVLLVAIWSMCLRKRFPAVRDYVALSAKSRKSKREILNEIGQVQDEPMRIVGNGYSVETVKSTRSANQYIIEPYESNENLEAEEIEGVEEENNLQSSPFYTVESHQDGINEIQRTDYLSDNSIQTPTWAYGENTSTNSLEEMDEIVQEKLSRYSESQTQIDGSRSGFNADEEGKKNEEDNALSCNNNIEDGPPLNVEGPLFTSEKVNDEIDDAQASKVQNEEMLQETKTDDSFDERGTPTEEKMDVEESMTLESEYTTLDSTMQTDVTQDTLDATPNELDAIPNELDDTSNELDATSNELDDTSNEPDATPNELDASFTSRATVDRFYHNNEYDSSLQNTCDESPFSDIYLTSKESKASPGRSQSAPLKVIKVQKESDDSQLVSYF